MTEYIISQPNLTKHCTALVGSSSSGGNSGGDNPTRATASPQTSEGKGKYIIIGVTQLSKLVTMMYLGARKE